MAYLYGYYKINDKDKTVNAYIEALYEFSDIETEDENKITFDILAQALGLECIGWLFTTLKEQDVKVKISDARQAAKFQEMYKQNHPSGCHISKFFTCMVSPNDSGQITYDTFMVSDLFQSMEKNNIFENNKNTKFLTVRKPKNGEIFPNIFVNDTLSDDLDINLFIVDIINEIKSVPSQRRIIKTYDFPIAANVSQYEIMEMIKSYFLIHKKDDGNYKCANLNFLLYIANNIGKETAINFANQIAEKNISFDVVELYLNLND